MVSTVPEGQLAFGVQLPIQSQSTIYVEPWETSAGPDELAAVARKADEAGFFYVGVCDHVAIPRPDDERMGTVWYDTVATLAWLAGITERVRLLSHVYNVAYRHPLVTAKAFATLDAVSGGRAILGVGAGHVEGEFDLLGADFSRRGRMTDDAIDVIRAALRSEYPKAETETWTVRDAGLAPRPHQEEVPIWVGGSSRPALRRAAERGDGWLPQGTPRDRMPEQIAYLLEHRRRAVGEEPFDIGVIAEPMYVGAPEWDVGSYTLAGSPEHLAGKLRELAEMGVSHAQVRLRSRSLEELLDQMDAFGSEVAPLLTG